MTEVWAPELGNVDVDDQEVARRTSGISRSRSPRAQFAARTLIAGLGAAATALAVYGAVHVTMPVTSDYGLVAALPTTYWIGLAGLNTAFGLAIWRGRQSSVLMAMLVAMLVLLLYGAPSLIDTSPRLEVAWRHLGIADQLLASGRIDPRIDAYFSWPGFFAGIAAFIDVGDLTPRVLALVAPLLNGLLWVLGVGAVARSLTPSRQHMWLTMWLFVVSNWLDQDYLSPQAFGFASYLLVMTLLLRYLGARPTIGLSSSLRLDGIRGWSTWWRSRTPDEHDPRLRVSAFLITVLLSGVMLASHQLTPIMLIAAVTALVVTGRLWSPHLLWVLMLMAALWLTTGASSYLDGHPVLFVQSLGESAAANVQQRIAGTPGHLRVVQVRTALTAVIFVLAVLGWLRVTVRSRIRDIRPVMLLAIPMFMVPLQSYGGEMLMRATLFSLPFAAFYAAGLFLPGPAERRVRAAPALVLLTTLSGVAVITGHYGNAAYDMFTRGEVQGVTELYRIAPRGAVLISATHSTPWKSQQYNGFKYGTLTDMCQRPLNPDKCYTVMRNRAFHTPAGALVLFTRGQTESLRIRGDAGEGAVERMERLLVGRGEARLVYRNRDAQIYQFQPWYKESP